MSSIKIILKNKTALELRYKDVLVSVLDKFEIPIFHNTVIIDEKSETSCSHPNITLVPSDTLEPLKILEILVHEQFHWYEARNTTPAFFEFIKHNYKYTGYEFDNYDTEHYSVLENFGQHLIVCYNTIAYMKTATDNWKIIMELEPNPYKTFEKFILESWDDITAELSVFNLIYDTCIVCGKEAKSQCTVCKIVHFCSMECFEKCEHKITCPGIPMNN